MTKTAVLTIPSGTKLPEDISWNKIVSLLSWCALGVLLGNVYYLQNRTTQDLENSSVVEAARYMQMVTLVIAILPAAYLFHALISSFRDNDARSGRDN